MVNETNNKNLYLAIALSVLVIVGWNYFYGFPQAQKARQVQAQQQAQVTSNTPQPQGVTGAASPAIIPGGAVPAAGTPEATRTRQEALAASPRITLDTRSLSGSIDLKGARIDDVALKNYRLTTDPNSPIIELLSPSGSPHPYYAEVGFVGQPGSTMALPGADTVWTADSDRLTAEKPVTLSYDNGQGLTFHRTISVDDQYLFSIKDTVENKGSAAVTLFPYALISRHGKPEVSNYAVLHEGLIGVIGDSHVQEIKYDAMEKETDGTRTLDGTGGWIGITDKYWATAVVPEQNAAFKGRFSVNGAAQPKTYQTDVLEDGKDLAPGQSIDLTTRVFAGAKENNTIDKYQAEFGIKNFDLMIDWGWFYFITKPLFKVLDFFYKLTGNFGVAILIVTVLIKGLFFPLASRSYLSMAKMKNVQPQLAAIKERFPDDKAKQQEATMEIYKREKINPVAGCLPMVVQIPVFFALYKVIFITIEMRHAPFFGWIKDLSSPDPTSVFNLFGLIPWTPPTPLMIGVWPLIMGVSMFLQMKMNPTPPDPVQKTMFTWMPVIFTYMLSSFPSGLVIYWTWNNTLSVCQQYLIMRRAGTKVELWDNLSGMFRRT
ncbi:membrane protein insertase YidC [Lichenihabitans sp. PAMC28606]|uniref:membrane protein insertase YidC n=1 Tax=Lichenihabitans sp. PAMC28606 TaxID=2880932 RepID=UPI001D09A555|nr:membrane protein insertase YidC [Lichenihabitans sp. PAMC28606]UDL94996.1 membrane protein insertase YidC [Lichenihabitans sp. PAMC28606]